MGKLMINKIFEESNLYIPPADSLKVSFFMHKLKAIEKTIIGG